MGFLAAGSNYSIPYSTIVKEENMHVALERKPFAVGGQQHGLKECMFKKSDDMNYMNGKPIYPNSRHNGHATWSCSKCIGAERLLAATHVVMSSHGSINEDVGVQDESKRVRRP